MPQSVYTLAVAMTGLHRKCGGYRRRGEGTPPCGEVTRSAAERADRGVRPYAAIRGVVRDRVGRPQGSPLQRVYKRHSWSWHAVYAYIRIYTIYTRYTRKSLAEFAARRRQKISNHFSPRHVRGEKYLSGCQCGILSLATKLCAQQTANPFGRKFRRNFLPVKKETPGGVSCWVVCRLYLTCRPWPCWPRPFRRRYRRASWTPQP